MSHFYVACALSAETGRVMLGTLQREQLTLSDVRVFQNQLCPEKDGLSWDIPRLYEELLEGLCGAGASEEPVESVSCSSWAGDYLLFADDGSLLPPAYHGGGPRVEAVVEQVLGRISWDTVYEETGARQDPASTLFQLGAETARRLKHASLLMPIADGFNYLLAGVPRVERSLAGTLQLYNPLTQSWSERVLSGLRLPGRLLPPLVAAGSELGPLRPEIAKSTGLAEARVIASCSHELAAALAGLPVGPDESWAFIRPGPTTLLGTQLAQPLIDAASRTMNFTNEPGYGGQVCFYKPTAGLWLLDECQRFWEKENRGLDEDLLAHLAASAPPFESLIDPADPRFLTSGDMPLKIQAFCKETNQPVPRKPGPVFRCILESLAFQYRKTLRELEYLTGAKVAQLYLLNGRSNGLLNHFIANALQVPLVLAPADLAAIGNVAVQALALGHLPSLEAARQVVGQSFKVKTIVPHGTLWDAAYQRFVALEKARTAEP